MTHVVDFEKTALSTSFRGVLPPSGPQISAESSMGYPLLGTRETRVVSTVPWPLFSRPTPPAPRPTTPRPAGSGRAQTLPRWLLPATDQPGSREVLLPPRPLRTGRESCPSSSSSIH